MSVIDKLTSKRAYEVLGPIQDRIDAISAEISALRDELGGPKNWRRSQVHKVLLSQKEQLETEYQQAEESLLAE